MLIEKYQCDLCEQMLVGGGLSFDKSARRAYCGMNAADKHVCNECLRALSRWEAPPERPPSGAKE